MRRRITGVVAVLLVSSAFLWAADVSELRTAFTDAIANGDAAQAIENYNDMVDQANKDYKKAQRSYEKALEAGNMLKAREARADMYNASYSAMTKDETDSLLSLILSENEEQKAKDVAWLLENSRYYNPSITYEWSSSGDNYSFSYSSTVSVVPGEELTLPDKDSIRINRAAAGILVGWGVTPDEITYQPGETITAPYTDQTLYAIWDTEVLFTDPITGTESEVTNVSSGDIIDVPSLGDVDDSYIFAGWVDRSTGEYIAPDETTVELEGNGAVFEALWKNAEISELESKHYDVSALPVNTQTDLSFVVTNNGTEDLKNIKVECTSEDGLSVLSGNGSIRSIPAGESVVVQGLKVVGTEPGDYMINISLTDRDDDVWSGDFPVTIV